MPQGSSKVLSDLRRIHAFFEKEGFSGQYCGSRIEYRLKKDPAICLTLTVKEDPYRRAGSHGQMMYKVANGTFLSGPACEEKAQRLLNEAQEARLTLYAPFDAADLKGQIGKEALAGFLKACKQSESLREPLKVLLKAVYDSLSQVKK